MFNSFSFQEEEEEAEDFEVQPKRLEPKSEIPHSVQVHSANTDEDDHNSLVQASKSTKIMKDFEEQLELINRRLSNMEQRMSIIIPLLQKNLNREV